MRYVTLCCVVLVAVAASAQDLHFGVHGNLVNFNIPDYVKSIAGLPQGNPETIALEEIYGMGYGGGAHLNVAMGLVQFRLSGDYSTISPDNEKFQQYLGQYIGGSASQFTVSGGKITIISGELNMKFTFLPLPVFKPYLTGGIGAANVKADLTTITFNGTALAPIELIKQQTIFTLNGGVGADIYIGGPSLYGEVRVIAFFIDPQTSTYLPIANVGITF
jgi:opacity protein-like surface antigen